MAALSQPQPSGGLLITLPSDPCQGARGHSLIQARTETQLRLYKWLYLLSALVSAFAFPDHTKGPSEEEIVNLEGSLAEPARARLRHLHNSLKASRPGGGGGERRKSPVLLGWQDLICCKLAAGSMGRKERTAEGVLPPADEVNRWSQELSEMSGELAQSP